MTRRELPIPVDDVENQSRYLDISDGFSERSSTLPTYEDAVRDTLSSAMEDSKGGDRKTVSLFRSSQAVERRSSSFAAA